MKSNRSMIRKYCAILALSVCSIIPAFAKGDVVGYVHGNVASTLSDSVQLEY